MCGITGFAYADSARPADSDVLRAMTQTLVHRGPDGEGFLVRPGVGLGVRRLNIIDLVTGDQPIANEDGSVTVVCDGEIYNYVELRRELETHGHTFRTHSDTEVIVHLYEEVGIGCLDRLRGMFGLAVWDEAKKTLLLARDRFGIKPLYYTERPDALYFGSEMKAILASGAVPRDPGLRGMRDLLTMGFVCAPATLFDAVRQLPPGCHLTYRGGATRVASYWDALFPRKGEEDRSRTLEAWAEALREKLDETVAIHLRSDVPLGAWLSPGVDSSSIVAVMGRHRSDPIPTATLRFEDPAYDEVRGRLTLLDDPEFDLLPRLSTYRAEDVERLPASIWHAEDPCAFGIEVVRDILGETSAEDVKVVLTGEGADEILAGYKRFRLDRLMRPLARLPVSVRRALLLGNTLPRCWPRASAMLVAPRSIRFERYSSTLGGPQPQGVDRILSLGFRTRLEQGVDDWDLALPSGFDRWHPLSQLQYYEIKIHLPSFVIHTLDRASMAHSVEARVPFLDHELFGLVARMPPALRLRGLREKHVLREAVRPLLPGEIVSRRKRGLRAPFGTWFRGSLPDFARDLLSESSLHRTGLFEASGVASLLDEHRKGLWNWSVELLVVLAVQIWHGLFVTGDLGS